MLVKTTTMPSQATGAAIPANNKEVEKAKAMGRSAVLHRHLDHEFIPLERGEGKYLITEHGQKIFDGSGGPSVACIGWGNERVIDAVTKQLRTAPFCATVFFTTQVAEDLGRFLVDSTKGHMARAYIVNSGSEAMEAALKLARQYFLEKTPSEPQRTHFIGRQQSYHGNTLGALSIGSHAYRRDKFEPLMTKNVSHVSPCYAYRGKHTAERDEQYVARLAKELDDEFQRVGPDTVCAFVAETIVGAALGCVPSVPGYFKAMKAVCDKYGALLILDEVMCGMGRSGTLHAWEQDGVAPDIQTIGKGLGGGYQPVSGVLASTKVIDTLSKGSSVFVHGHTYQGHPVGCAAALEVQRIIQEDNLLENVRELGLLLSNLLKERLSNHPNVGDIRGRGFFWGIELVADKQTKAPFPSSAHVSMEICERGLSEEYSTCVYPAGGGGKEGSQGDAIIISPPYTVTKEEIRMLVSTVVRLINDFFKA